MTVDDSPVVATVSGRVRGVRRDESAAFLGIPFAAAPVGVRRFGAPEPPEPWSGVRDATEYGPTPQRRPMSETTLVPEPSRPGDDTLNVNVFTPAAGSGAALPVVVWIHGGGFTAGSPASPFYDGRAFNRDGVVVVTVSYRLGFDGFGIIPGSPSNRGVRDWLAALEWVQNNIAAFGGDPGRVTIAGQSAGGGAVLTLLGMPQAQHLFHAAWAMSPAVANVTVERAGTVAAKLATLGEVPASRDGFVQLPEERILDLQAQAELPASGSADEAQLEQLRNGMLWGPVLDGDLLPRTTYAAIADGVGADKPLVLGTADDEFTMATGELRRALDLVPAGIALTQLEPSRTRRAAYLRANRTQRRRGTRAVLGRYIGDAVFRAPTVRYAAARGDAPTWMYRFTWPSPVVGWACHCVDIPFWFDVLDARGAAERLLGPNPPQPLADAVHGSAVDLIRTGAVGWPVWSDASGTTRVFGAGPSQPDVIGHGYASVRALVPASTR